MAQELFTLTTLGTLAGATGATVIVGNTIQSVANYSAKWLSLLVAQVIVIAVAFFTGATEISAYFVSILNGCLVYASAVGLNTMTSKPTSSGPPIPRSTQDAGRPPKRTTLTGSRSFGQRWWS